MNKLGPHRRKAVVFATSCAAMSGVPVLLRGHHAVLAVWLAFDVTLIVAAFVQLKRAKEAGE